MPKSATAQAIAAYLSAAMRAKKLTQTRLAKLSGVSQSYIGRLLRGTSAPTADVLERLAGAIGVPVSDMTSQAPPLSRTNHGDDGAESVARLVTAYAKCGAEDQRIILELAERLAPPRSKK